MADQSFSEFLAAPAAERPAPGSFGEFLQQPQVVDKPVAPAPDARPLRPSDLVTHPDVVDRKTTARARVWADTMTRPGPARPPLTPGLEPDVPGMTRELLIPSGNRGPVVNEFPNRSVTAWTTRVGDALTSGIERMAEPGLREKAGGLHETASGAFDLATPVMATEGV